MLRQVFRVQRWRWWERWGWWSGIGALLFVVILVAVSSVKPRPLRSEETRLFALPITFCGGQASVDNLPERVNAIYEDEFNIRVSKDGLGDHLVIVEMCYSSASGKTYPSISSGWHPIRASLFPMWRRLKLISPLLIPRFETAYLPDYPGHIEDVDVLVDLVVALGLFNLDECNSASRFFKRALMRADFEDKATFSYVNFYLGTCEIATGNLQQAVKYYELAIENWNVIENHSGTGLAFNLAWLYIQLNRVEDAYALLTIFDERHLPSHGDFPYALLSRRAKLYTLASDHEAALADLDTAIRLAAQDQSISPRSTAGLYRHRGRVYEALGQWDDAFQDYTTAIGVYQPGSEVFYYRGMLRLNHMNDTDGALDDIRYYLQNIPVTNYADAFYHRGVFYYTVLRDRTNALADFERYQRVVLRGQYIRKAVEYAEMIQDELEAVER